MHKPRIAMYQNAQATTAAEVDTVTYTVEENTNIHGLRVLFNYAAETEGDVIGVLYSVQCVPRDQTSDQLDGTLLNAQEIPDMIWMFGSCLVSHDPVHFEFMPATSRSCHKEDKFVISSRLNQKVVGTGNLRSLVTASFWVSAL